jgi:hypothetical protein
MDAIGSINSTATQAAQAVQAGQATPATGSTKTQATPSGLPPANLTAAASANSMNAALVASQWGLDPSTMAGVYGEAGENGGLFAGDSLLPLLTTISHANAEQALTLIGVQLPKPSAAASAAAAAAAPSSSSAAATSTAGQAALNEAVAQSSSSPMMVDPLWGRSA